MGEPESVSDSKERSLASPRRGAFAEPLVVVVLVEIAIASVLLWKLDNIPIWMVLFLNGSLLLAVVGPLIVWRAQAATERREAPGLPPGGMFRNVLVPIATMLFGLSLTALAVQRRDLDLQNERRARLEVMGGRLQREISKRFEWTELGVRGTASLARSVPGLKRDALRAYWNLRRVSSEFPGVRGFGLIQHIERKDSLELLRTQRADDAPDFSIRSTGSEPDLFVITNIEPLVANRQAQGYDVGSERRRREAVDECLATGEMTLTRPIVLVQDGRKRVGFLYLKRIDREGRARGSATLAYAPLVLEELLAGLDSIAGPEYSIVLREAGPPDTAKPLYEKSLSQGRDVAEDPTWIDRRSFVVGRRTFELVTTTRGSGEGSVDLEIVLTAVGGAVFSLLVGSILVLLGLGQRRVVILAQRMSMDLVAARQDADKADRYNQAVSAALRTQTIFSILDKEGRLLEVNQAYRDISGYSDEELVGIRPRVLVSGSQGEAYWEAFARQIESGRSWRGENERMSKEGRHYWLDTMVVPLLSPDGTVDRYVAVSYDITERKRAETALRETSSRLAAVLDSATEIAIIASDVEGRIEVFNSGAERMLGWTKAEMLGKTPAVFHDPEEVVARGRELTESEGVPIEGFEVFVHAAKIGRPERRQWTYVRKDGSRFPIALVVTLLRGGDGEPIGYIGVAVDISETVAYQTGLHLALRAAEAANKAKGAFLANMSHEIRTPMNGVLGMLGILRDTDLSPEQRHAAEVATASAESLLGLINDILDFSKIEAGKLDLEKIPFDLEALLADMASLMGLRAKEKGLSLEIPPPRGMPTRLLGDPGRLRQILVNLVGNAIKFTPHGGIVVETGLERWEDEQVVVRFAVRDTGIGIPPDRVGALFQSFEQVDASITRKFGGTGLGLAICRQLAELMGGSIAVQSRLGEGTEFRVVVKFDVAGESTEESSRSSLAHRRVLVVDGDPVGRDVLLELLARSGMRPTAVGDGALAQEVFLEGQREGDPFEVVVLDGELPDGDAISIGTRLRGMATGTAPLLVAAVSDSRRDDFRTFDAAGFAVYLPKPVRATDLDDCLALAIGRRSTGREGPAITRHAARETRELVRFQGRVLLAEDNAVNQKVAQAMLAKMGLQVETVGNGLEAVERLSNGGFDLVLMDMQMPEMDGLEATRRIRSGASGAAQVRVPVVALTANAMREDQEACRRAGMDDHVSKPLSRADLVEVLGRHLQEAV